jgi:hypothetical protein
MNLEITTRNLNHGSPLSVSIDTTPPKGVYSIASLPRMNLNGRMEKINGTKEVRSSIRLIVGTKSVEMLFASSS